MPTALALATVALGPIRRACWTGIVPVGIVVRVSFVWRGCLVSFCVVSFCVVSFCVVSVFGIFCLVSLFVSLVGDRALGRSCYCITCIHVVCTASLHHTDVSPCRLFPFSPHPHSPHPHSPHLHRTHHHTHHTTSQQPIRGQRRNLHGHGTPSWNSLQPQRGMFRRQERQCLPRFTAAQCLGGQRDLCAGSGT